LKDCNKPHNAKQMIESKIINC